MKVKIYGAQTQERWKSTMVNMVFENTFPIEASAGSRRSSLDDEKLVE